MSDFWSKNEKENEKKLISICTSNRNITNVELQKTFPSITKKSIAEKRRYHDLACTTNIVKGVTKGTLKNKRDNSLSIDEEKLLSLLKNNSYSPGEISRVLDRSKETVFRIAGDLQKKGYVVKFSDLNKQFVLDTTRSSKITPLNIKSLYKKYIKFGIVSDTHLGSNWQQPTLLHTAYKILDDEKVDFVVHCGDVSDGVSMRKGHEQEVFLPAKKPLVWRNYIINTYPHSKTGFKTYVIGGGTHDWDFVKTHGYNLVQEVCNKRDDIIYKGDVVAQFNIKNTSIRIMHPAGGISYALSYKTQKVAEGMINSAMELIRERGSIEELPSVVVFGHWHVSSFIPCYMGMDLISAPCFQDQTPYLQMKGLYPKIGFVIVEMFFDDNNCVTSTRVDFRHMGSRVIKNDYPTLF